MVLRARPPPAAARPALSYTRAHEVEPAEVAPGCGMRSFLAGYAGCPLLMGLVAAIVIGIAKHSVAESLMIVPRVLAATLLAYVLAPLGPIAGS